MQLSEEKIFKLVDERNRILNRIGSLQENVEALVENLEDPNPGIIAQIEEAKNQIRDLSPKFGDQLLKINRFFLPKLKEKRKEVVNTNKRHRAVLAYLKSPSFNSG